MAQNISSIHFLNLYIWAFLVWKTFNCHIIETVRDSDLIPKLRAGPKHELSSGSLVVEDYTQHNRGDYMQQNCGWAALESFKSSLCVLIAKKVVLSNQKNTGFYWSLATKLSKNAGSPNLLLAPFKNTYGKLHPLHIVHI